MQGLQVPAPSPPCRMRRIWGWSNAEDTLELRGKQEQVQVRTWVQPDLRVTHSDLLGDPHWDVRGVLESISVLPWL